MNFFQNTAETLNKSVAPKGLSAREPHIAYSRLPTFEAPCVFRINRKANVPAGGGGGVSRSYGKEKILYSVAQKCPKIRVEPSFTNDFLSNCNTDERRNLVHKTSTGTGLSQIQDEPHWFLQNVRRNRQRCTMDAEISEVSPELGIVRCTLNNKRHFVDDRHAHKEKPSVLKVLP